MIKITVYGDFREAHHHLRVKMIATRNPEDIRNSNTTSSAATVSTMTQSTPGAANATVAWFLTSTDQNGPDLYQVTLTMLRLSLKLFKSCHQLHVNSR